MGTVEQLRSWEAVPFPWGAGVRDRRTGQWTNIVINGQAIDVSNRDVELHENGIEFLDWEGPSVPLENQQLRTQKGQIVSLAKIRTQKR